LLGYLTTVFQLQKLPSFHILIPGLFNDVFPTVLIIWIWRRLEAQVLFTNRRHMERRDRGPF